MKKLFKLSLKLAIRTHFWNYQRCRKDETSVFLFPVLTLLIILVISSCKTSKVNVNDSEQDGFVKIFDGKTLDGWEGDPTYWRVEDGKIVGEITPETIVERNVFLIWREGLTRDFELKVEYRVSGEGNSGINYRSEEVKDVPYHALRGYQADIDGKNRWTGMNYEERRRTTIAARGEKVVLPAISKTESLANHIEQNQWAARMVKESLGDPDSLTGHINDDWNEYHIIVQGNRLQHFVNGVLMSDVTDEDTVNRRFEGLLGVQVHVGPPMKIEYRNFRIKQL